MSLLRPLICAIAITLGPPSAWHAAAFPPPGLWDPQPLDVPARPPAWIGAKISAAEARINATKRPRAAGVGPGGNPLVQNCSLQIGSVNLPRGLSGNSTIVTNSDVRGTIIQVCR
jgi:hypothetical protein